jgi:hypothetical protein
MPSKKKKLTDAELRDKLWEMAQTINWSLEDESSFRDHPDFVSWENAMTGRKAKKYEIPAFEVAAFDLKKIKEEVEDSCLSDETKKAILEATKKSKAK